MKYEYRQGGIAHIAIVVAIIVFSAVAFGGWWVWSRNNQNDSNKQSNGKTSQNNQNMEDRQPLQKTISLLDGKVSFIDDGSWKVATGGYWSIESGRCGRGTDFDEGCIDHKMLIPANEAFTNPDQFQVNISVFKNDALGTSLEQWVDLEVSPGGANPKKSYPTIDGHEAYRYEVAYDENDIRLVYGIAFEDKIVVVRSNFFKGNYNGYKSTNNYLPLISQVNKLVESMSFK